MQNMLQYNSKHLECLLELEYMAEEKHLVLMSVLGPDTEPSGSGQLQGSFAIGV